MPDKYQFPENYGNIFSLEANKEEWARIMIVAGMIWYDDNPLSKPAFLLPGNPNHYVKPVNKSAYELMKTMRKATGWLCTSRLVQHIAVIECLTAKEIGWDNYILELSKINK